MSTSPLLPPAPAEVLTRAGAVVGELDERLWAAVGDLELVDVVEAIARLRARLAALEAEVLVEVDVRGVPRRRLHWASTAAWYAHCTGTTRGVAKRTVRDAHDLLADRQPTRDRLRRGEISPTQAAVVCRGIRDLPGDPALRRRAETVLLQEATRLDATDLTTAAARVLDVVDPDRTDRRLEAELAAEDRAAHADRFLTISDDGYGGIRLRGRGTLEDDAVLRAALLPLTAPAPAAATEGDQTEGGRDVRDHGARLWDALLATAQHALDTHLPPTGHATTPRVSVTIPIADLLAGTGLRTATTDDGLPLHPAVVRRLACEAEVIPLVLGTHGEVLDVGRTHRTVTPPIWRALVARDRHCAFPGCTRPPLMTHAHHVTHWADGGTTALHNLVLLCGEHHRTVHHTPWQVRINPHDELPEFLPPPRHRTLDDPDTGGPPQPSWIRHRTRGAPG